MFSELYMIDEEFRYRDREEYREKDLFRVYVSKVYKDCEKANEVVCVCM
jgi:hypothetical protein